MKVDDNFIVISEFNKIINDEIKNYWEKELTVGRSKRTNIDLFLQAYLFIKISDKSLKVTTDDKKRFFKIDSVFNSFKNLFKFSLRFWCGRRDSNSHGKTHTPLKRACLPISARPH